ncbi:MAG: YIP1 family protein [Candidatus Aminicenantes bacterium]|nr:MAG: YIP1 family protein [Candidatus Aminicenantes bacterium]
MDFNAIIKRAIAIITKPKDEWQVIKSESMTITEMFTKYAIFLAAIPAIAGFLGWIIIGRSYGPFTIRAPIGRALLWAIFMYALSLAAVYLLAIIIDALAPSFGAQKDMVQSMKVVVFSSTAAWVGGIFHLIPVLAILALLCGLYGLYLLYLGMKSLKEPPQDKMAGYFVVTLIVSIVVQIVILLLVGVIAFGSARAFFSF